MLGLRHALDCFGHCLSWWGTSGGLRENKSGNEGAGSCVLISLSGHQKTRIRGKERVFHMNSERSLHASAGKASSVPNTRLRGACSRKSGSQQSQRKFSLVKPLSSYLRSFSVTQLWHRAVPHAAQDVKCMDCGPWLQ